MLKRVGIFSISVKLLSTNVIGDLKIYTTQLNQLFFAKNWDTRAIIDKVLDNCK